MAQNEILDELHEVRRQLLEQYDGDTSAYLQDAKARLEASGRPVWQGIQRKIKFAETSVSDASGQDR